ncbi:MAG: hypothetical protein ACXVRS_09690, partial [Gaiellaceae bacterium]
MLQRTEVALAVDDVAAGAGNRRRDREQLLAEVLAELLVVSEHFDEYLRPPQPPGTLGTCRSLGWAAEPDYPPSTCGVRVVRLGCKRASVGLSEPGAGAGAAGEL